MRGKISYLLPLLVMFIIMASTTIVIAPLGTCIAAPIMIDEAAAPGSSVDIDIVVKDTVDLYGFDFTLYFDPGILMADDVTVGDFLPDNFIWLKDIGADHVKFIVTRKLGAAGGISGSGVLATVHFTLLGEGVSTLDLSATVLSDSSGIPMSHSTIDGVFCSAQALFPYKVEANLRTMFVEDRRWELSKDPAGYVTLTGKIKNIGDLTTLAKVVFRIYDSLGGLVDEPESPTVYIDPNTESLDLSADFYVNDYLPEEFTVEAQVFYWNGMAMVGGNKGGHRETMTKSFFASE